MVQIDPKIRQSLAKHGLFFDDEGCPMFNGGNFISKEELEDIIEEYESEGDLKNYALYESVNNK